MSPVAARSSISRQKCRLDPSSRSGMLCAQPATHPSPPPGLALRPCTPVGQLRLAASTVARNGAQRLSSVSCLFAAHKGARKRRHPFWNPHAAAFLVFSRLFSSFSPFSPFLVVSGPFSSFLVLFRPFLCALPARHAFSEPSYPLGLLVGCQALPGAARRCALPAMLHSTALAPSCPGASACLPRQQDAEPSTRLPTVFSPPFEASLLRVALAGPNHLALRPEPSPGAPFGPSPASANPKTPPRQGCSSSAAPLQPLQPVAPKSEKRGGLASPNEHGPGPRRKVPLFPQLCPLCPLRRALCHLPPPSMAPISPQVWSQPPKITKRRMPPTTQPPRMDSARNE